MPSPRALPPQKRGRTIGARIPCPPLAPHPDNKEAAWPPSPDAPFATCACAPSGPVWTALYALMGVSAWLVWRERGLAGARTALALFIAQLAANALWSWLFFAWRLGGPAFAEVLLLWCLIAATAIAFRRIRLLAAVLLLPYLAWVTFAAALTLAVWRLNPALLG